VYLWSRWVGEICVWFRMGVGQASARVWVLWTRSLRGLWGVEWEVRGTDLSRGRSRVHGRCHGLGVLLAYLHHSFNGFYFDIMYMISQFWHCFIVTLSHIALSIPLQSLSRTAYPSSLLAYPSPICKTTKRSWSSPLPFQIFISVVHDSEEEEDSFMVYS
jgi:hypothetical protein